MHACSALAPGCVRYGAAIKKKNISGDYTALGEEQLMIDNIKADIKLRLFAVPPQEGENARTLVNPKP